MKYPKELGKMHIQEKESKMVKHSNGLRVHRESHCPDWEKIEKLSKKRRTGGGEG